MSEQDQLSIGRALAAQIGFDPLRGRYDIAKSGFNSGTRQDGRIAARNSETRPIASLSTMIHEVGHALYGWNLPEKWDGQPVGAADDLSLHESQSLILQRNAGLSPGFQNYLYDFICGHKPEFAEQCSLQDLQHYFTAVKPGFVRLESDEATYPLHIILRYEIEKKLFAGTLSVRDIPEFWNHEMKQTMDLDVPEYRLGCMQDVHWFKGLYGYFPTYTQGALYAAQLFSAIATDIPTIEQELAQGDFSSMNRWLNEKIHRWGQFYDAPELIERATGNKPDARYFLDHLRNRYL